ncbi:hypothetical protein GCM10011588_22890 [Nocardia jinanensis]|uniref:Uncharacterized protein n=1 Tax=Nocardia jinanensis TaxID=382504 RepID=A0A917RH09_9NOCA|nr:hypothetical protein GCM10011588_22890 [Nocardia jinanensis]
MATGQCARNGGGRPGPDPEAHQPLGVHGEVMVRYGADAKRAGGPQPAEAAGDGPVRDVQDGGDPAERHAPVDLQGVQQAPVEGVERDRIHQIRIGRCRYPSFPARGADRGTPAAHHRLVTSTVHGFHHTGPVTPRPRRPHAQIRVLRLHPESATQAAGRILPGESLPGGSYLAAMTIAVTDIGRARRAVEDGGVGTRSTGTGFFVSACAAYGAGLFFTTAG